MTELYFVFFFFSSRRRHTRLQGDWSSDVCSSDLHDHPLDQILQFANVPGVAQAREALHHRLRNGESIAAVELRAALDEVLGQGREFARALAGRWDENVDDGQPLIEIFAEGGVSDRPLQVPV